MTDARLLFAGTPEFARSSLEALVDAGLVPVAVLTQPDRPAGRGKKLTPSPVKVCAEAHGIPVLQPATLKDPQIVEELASLEPDLMIVAAYGLLLPQAVLEVPRMGCLNVHASLLPRWRGAAPIQQAILSGDEDTGICLMQMDEGLDTGAVYACASLAIGEAETAGELHDRLAVLGGTLLVSELAGILAGDTMAVPQDDEAATYAGKIRKHDARLDWSASATDLARRTRAYNPAPGAWFELDGERVKCWRAVAIDDAKGPPGVVLNADKKGVDVGCGDGALRLLEVQRPGRRKIAAAAFADQLPLTGKRFD